MKRDVIIVGGDPAEERFSYPLVATYADRFFANRFAVIGNAAASTHPVAARGFNMGLKGQHILADQLKKVLQRGNDIGATSVLSSYDGKHRLARKAVLRLGNHIRPAKKAMMHQLTEVQEAA